MATQKEIEELYDWLDRFQELRLGKNADITCAFFDGNFKKTLREAQKDKHEWILKGIKFRSGQRILDIGCGCGPMLKAIKEKKGKGLGLTLSSAQVKYCKKNGIEARLLDWKKAKNIGKFDGIVSVGAFEHFCSEEEMNDGKQEEIYEQFFNFCSKLLPKKGRLFLQTMGWGKKVPMPKDYSLKNSEEVILSRLRKFYPGSWLPNGKKQIIKTAKSKFRYIKDNNGRKDYIETLKRWGEGTKSLITPPKILLTLKEVIPLIPRAITDPNFRVQLASLYRKDQSQSFIRNIMGHERIFFEKR